MTRGDRAVCGFLISIAIVVGSSWLHAQQPLQREAPPPAEPLPPGVVFASSWDTAQGESPRAVTDGGRWPNYWEFNNGFGGIQLLSVVPGGPAGHNALRVEQRGDSAAANLQLSDFVPASQSYYLRYYMRNDDSSPEGDHVVTVDTWQHENLTFMRKSSSNGSDWKFVITMAGCGFTYPIGHWGPAVPLVRGQWYRFEYHVEFVDPIHIRVHPRVYDADNNLLMSDDQFLQEDFGSAEWNGRQDWTLASYYAAGNSFCVDPTWTNDFGIGNNGQAGAISTRLPWFFSGIEIRTDDWPGPIQ